MCFSYRIYILEIRTNEKMLNFEICMCIICLITYIGKTNYTHKFNNKNEIQLSDETNI